jgi:Ca2+-binding RTX toxin-like protein
VSVSTANLLTQIDGLHAQVQITGADAGLDRLQIDTGAGDDAVDASALRANLFQFGVTLGDGNDAFIGSAGKDVVDGGDGFDILSGEDGNDVLDGGAGIDILTGGAGDDLFVNGEIIQDFIAGAGSEDRIDLRAFGASFDWVMEHASDTDAGVLFDFDGAQMLLGGVAASSLHQDDFLLA